MAKVKKKFTVEQKRINKEAKAKRQKEYMWVFMNRKQVRVKRPPIIDGIPEGEWIEQNAVPIWLHQNEMWDVLDARESQEEVKDNDMLKR